MISAIYWIGPNKTEEFEEDIVIELHDGRQFSFFLNKNVTLYKTAAFNKFVMISDHAQDAFIEICLSSDLFAVVGVQF